MSFADRVNQSNWFRWTSKKMDRIYLSSTRSFKVLKRTLIGEGTMMRKFNEITAIYYASDFAQLERIREEFIRSPPGWIPHIYKQHELVIYINYLLGVRRWNRLQRQRMLYELKTLVDVRHELGVKIIEVATIVADNAVFGQSRSLVQPHQQR